jgi:DNA-directed RNA polymerase subunit F
MIKNNEPISIAEITEYVKDKGKEDKIKIFVKKFAKTDIKKAKELRKKLEAIDMMKMKPEYIAKIIDFLPEDNDELNKIFQNISLDEDETKKILDAVKSI